MTARLFLTTKSRRMTPSRTRAPSDRAGRSPKNGAGVPGGHDGAHPRREDGDLEHGGHEVLDIERGVAKEEVEGKLLALIATMSRKCAPTFATKSFSPSKDRSRGP